MINPGGLALSLSQAMAPRADRMSQGFLDSERSLRYSRTVVALCLGVILMPAGVTLDAMLYPNDLMALAAIRFGVSAVLACGLFFVWRLGERDPLELVSLVLISLPAFGIAWMMHLTEGAASNYYVGLILLMIIVQLLGFRLSEAVLYCGLTLLAYVVAVVTHPEFDASDWVSLGQGVFFIVASSLVCIAVCHLNRRNRLTSFLLQQQLRDQAQARLDLFANVSHELRTPLALIVAPLDEILLSRGQFSEPLGQRISIVRRNVDRLRLLVDDLLDVVRQRNDTFRLNLTEIDARDFVEQIVYLASDTATANGLRLEFSGDTEPTLLWVDEPRLERVFLNLLGNAFKFSPSGGLIEVEFRREGDIVCIEVSDQGPGIPEAVLSKVFDRMFQAENTSQTAATHGLGLGLAISKEIVLWHGGTIEARNRVTGGTTFEVRLPIKSHAVMSGPSGVISRESNEFESSEDVAVDQGLVRRSALEKRRWGSWRSVAPGSFASDAASDVGAPQEELAGVSRPPEPIKLGRILIVDDEPDLRGYLTSRLAEHFEVYQASNASDGLRIAVQQTPDCILLDLMLPDSYRLSTLEKMRAHDGLCDTKILMMTANVDEQIKIEAIRRGADDFLPKPFGIAELEARVGGLVRSAKQQRDLRRRQEELEESLRQLKKTEQQLFQSEKIRAIAGLAAGLLHEINNPASFSLMAVRVLRKRAQLSAESLETLDQVEDGVTRISRIVSDLQSFAHPDQQQHRSAFPLVNVVNTAERFTHHELQGIEFVVDNRSDNELHVYGSESQLVQVLVNLLTNAAKAIRRGDVDRAGKVVVRLETHGNHVTLAVVDNGVGMTSEQLRRVREPFFTTEETGQGLGLGLSICDSIVVAHGGQLELESELAVGTTIRLRLPIHSSVLMS